MPLIALTGGIASGKSTISGRLAAHGAVIVDADQIVRDVQRPGSAVLGEIANAFGDEMIAADGSLERRKLGERVFGDPAALAQLNAIVHPAVRVESHARFDDAFRADPGAVVVYDVPLLVEARSDDPWDLIVVAEAPRGIRHDRLVRLRGLRSDEADARIDAQVSDEQRRTVADAVIDTAGTLAQTHAQVDRLWERIVTGV